MPRDIPPVPEEFGPEPGWSALYVPRAFGIGRSFVSGDVDGDRLRMWYYRRDADGALLAKVWFGPGAEGPPGHAHGGSMAAVLDEAMGIAAWVQGHPVVAATITINFHRRLPLERVLRVECQSGTPDGKKVISTGRIFDPETDRNYSTGEGTFVIQPMESFGSLIDALENAPRG